MLQHAISQFCCSFNIFRVDFGHLCPEIQYDLFIAYCSSFYGAPLWTIFSTPSNSCIQHGIAFALKINGDWYSTKILQIRSNIFQNGTPVLRTIVLTALDNPLSVFCSNYNTIIGHGNMNCLEARANLYKDWLTLLPGDLTCNANALRELLSTRDDTHVSVLSFDEMRFYWWHLLESRFYVSSSCITFCHILFISDIFICPNLLLFIGIACVFICLFSLTHMWFLSMCFTVPYLLVNYV